MDERPLEVPQPIPEIPKKVLWLTLATPPLATILASFLVTITLPALLGRLLLLIPLGVVYETALFGASVERRYRGPSLGFLILSYFFGQIIICFILWAATSLPAYKGF